MTTNKAVTSGSGKFLGRLSMTDVTLSWVGPARAYVFDEASAVAAASQFGGSVVNAPVWDAASSAYVVPA